MIPLALYMLALSATIREGGPAPGVVGTAGTGSMVAERTDRGKDSREPPNTDEGARARTLAFVSRERRRRPLEDDASVKMDALSVSSPLAVAVVYVCCGLC